MSAYKSYIAAELRAVSPQGWLMLDEKPRVKITSERGETKWLSINPAQAAAIERALIDNADK